MGRAAAAFEEIGSSRDSLRDEVTPDGEDDRELWASSALLEASDASSNESLGGCRPAY